MATTSHLWRATRVNTRKNSTKASVAQVLNAERVRAAHSAAASAGVASAALSFVGAGAAPRPRRVVAFDESVTVHYLPPDDYEDEPTLEEGICASCHAPIDEERRRWRRAWGLLRQVDELDGRRGVCRCNRAERSRYPEYAVEGDEVIVEDDAGSNSASPEEHRASTEARSLRSMSDDHRHSLGTENSGSACKLPLAQEPPPAPAAQPRDRALRFQSRSRSRKKSQSTPNASSTEKVGEANETERAESRKKEVLREPREARRSQLTRVLSDDSNLGVQAIVAHSRRESSPVPGPPIIPEPGSPEPAAPAERPLLKSALSQNVRSDTPSPPRLVATLSEIRRRMVVELSEDDAQTSVVAGRRSRTLPPPGARVASRPSFVRLSSMSDVESGAERTSNAGELALSRIATSAPDAAGAKQLSQLTPTHGSPSDGAGSKAGSSAGSRVVSGDDIRQSASRVEGVTEFSMLPPSASNDVEVTPLSPTTLARLRTSPAHKDRESGNVGAPSAHFAVESALSAASAPAMGPDNDENGGRLRYRGRRARAAAQAARLAAEQAAAANVLAEPAPNDLAQQMQARILRRSTARERSFAGFCARDASAMSGAGTRFEERREEFSAYQVQGTLGTASLMKTFSRAARTDTNSTERATAPRKKAPLRNLRVRVSRLMRGAKSAPPSEDAGTVAEKLSRQMCIKHDAY